MRSARPWTAPTPPGHRWVFAGVILMSLSLLLWVGLLGVPFLPLSVAARGAVATTLIVIAEVAFWVGAVIAGPATARRMRSWWRRPSGDDARVTADGSAPEASARHGRSTRPGSCARATSGRPEPIDGRHTADPSGPSRQTRSDCGR
ncbi:MAG: transporter suffix domain-containing protein [Acidobacteria bacterium]|nr:MAG: transporter suffix domain-containing protein [Acidobacteriota bacterium]